MSLPEAPSGTYVAPGPQVRVYVTAAGADVDTSPLAAASTDRGQRAGALFVRTSAATADALENRDEPGAPASLADAMREAYARVQRFAPAGVGGRSIDVFAEPSRSWFAVKRVLRAAYDAGFASVGFGARRGGSTVVFVYRLPTQEQYAAMNEAVRQGEQAVLYLDERGEVRINGGDNVAFEPPQPSARAATDPDERTGATHIRACIRTFRQRYMPAGWPGRERPLVLHIDARHPWSTALAYFVVDGGVEGDRFGGTQIH